MNVATAFTGVKGQFVPIKETIESFRQIIDGEADDIPEAAFFMVGSIKDAREKAMYVIGYLDIEDVKDIPEAEVRKVKAGEMNIFILENPYTE